MTNIAATMQQVVSFTPAMTARQVANHTVSMQPQVVSFTPAMTARQVASRTVSMQPQVVSFTPAMTARQVASRTVSMQQAVSFTPAFGVHVLRSLTISMQQVVSFMPTMALSAVAHDAPTPLWIDDDHIGETTVVDRPTFRAKFAAFGQARAVLLTALSESARLAGLQTDATVSQIESLMATIADAAGYVKADRILDGDSLGLDVSRLIGQIIAGMVADGAITAEKIVAGAIGTAHLAAGSVVAAKLAVDELSAITANLGTVTAGLLQGAVIRTLPDSLGNYIQIAGQSIRGLDSDGDENWVIDGGNGAVSINFTAPNLLDDSGASVHNSQVWQTRTFYDESLPPSHIYNKARYAIVELKLFGAWDDGGTFEIGPEMQGTNYIPADAMLRWYSNQYLRIRSEESPYHVNGGQFIVPIANAAYAPMRTISWHFLDTLSGGSPTMVLLLRGFIA